MAGTQLIVSGSIARDRIMNFSGKYKDLIHPEKLHVLSVSVLIDKLEETRGGVGVNICYNSAQLGDNPILLGSAGKDSKDYVDELKSKGINTDYVYLSDLPTASFSVITDSANNQVGGFYPGAMLDADTLTVEPWENQDALVVISAHSPEAMRRQAEDCKRLGIKYMYDPGQQVTNLGGEDMLASVAGAEIIAANDYEMGVLCEKAGITIEEIKAKTPIVITTFGAEGSVIEGTATQEPIKVPAAKPNEVKDPSGAGDSYRAGFLHGYLRQWELRKCAQLGSVWSSFIVEQHGTLHDLDKQAVIDRYQATFNERIEL